MTKKSIFKRWWFWVIAVVIVIAAISSQGGSEKTEQVSKNTSTQQEKKSEPKKEDANKITYEKFGQVTIGMTYEQVKGILGDGKETTSSEVNGMKTVIYSWSNPGGSNMNVTFQDNKALSKAQLGLAKGNANVNMEKYDKIQTGITYDQAKEILGEGQVTSMSQFMESTSVIYTWANSGGSNMNVTFQDGKVAAKAQIGLK